MNLRNKLMGTTKNDAKGFTIVEVVIVLAIAGLILLIVFLAVPALQRSSRNTGRKSDVARIGAAVSNYVSNHNGQLPTVPAQAAQRNAIIQDAGNLSQYDFVTTPGNFPFSNTAPGGPMTNVARIQLVEGAQCDTTLNDGSVAAGTAKQAALQYALEDANGGAGTAGCVNI